MKTLLLFIAFVFISFSSDKLIPVQKEGKWGYCNQDKKLIIDYSYSSASIFNTNGVAVVSQKGKYGVINKQNEWVIKAKYQNIESSLKENEFIVTNNKGKVGVINTANKKLIDFSYDSVKVFDSNHSYLVYEDHLCGLYNTKLEKWELPVDYVSVAFNRHGLIQITQENAIGFISEEAYAMVTPPSIILNKTRGGKDLDPIAFNKWNSFTVVKTNTGYNILSRDGKLQLSESSSIKINTIDFQYYFSLGFKLPYNAEFIAGDKVYLKSSDFEIETKNLEDFKVRKTLTEGVEIKQVKDSKKYALYAYGDKISFDYDSIFHYNEDFVKAVTYNEDGEKNMALLAITKNKKIKAIPVVDGFESIISYIPKGRGETSKEWVIIMDNMDQQGIFDLETKEFVVDMKYHELYVPFIEKYGLVIIGNLEDKYAFYDINSHKQVTDMKYDANINTESLVTHELFLEREGVGKESERVLDLFSLKERRLTGKTINGYDINKRKPVGTVHFSQKLQGWETNLEYQLSEFAPEKYQFYFLQDKGDGKIGIGFLDQQYNIVLPPNYATVEFENKGNPYLKVTDFDLNEGIVSIDGKVIIPLGKYKSVGAMIDGVAPVVDNEGNHFFVNNKDERYIVKP